MKRKKFSMPSGRLCLEIRGNFIGLKNYVEKEAWNLVRDNIVWYNKLEDCLSEYNQNPSEYQDNLIIRDWISWSNRDIESLRELVREARVAMKNSFK